MKLKNYEFKARTNDLDLLEQKLLELNPEFIGVDHQVDTYFKVTEGRLKLREGNIENALIYYERPDIAGAKQADIILYKHYPDKSLKDILTKVHGIKTIIDKTRRIYFIENVKFHFDAVTELGHFIEVEAIDEFGQYSVKELQKQCDLYSSFFGIEATDYISKSYSDLVLEKSGQ
jgi:adenylate cyclase class 2